MGTSVRWHEARVVVLMASRWAGMVMMPIVMVARAGAAMVANAGIHRTRASRATMVRPIPKGTAENPATVTLSTRMTSPPG